MATMRRDEAMSVTEDMRTEHQHLMASVESLREAGDAAGSETWESAEDKAEQALSMLKTELLPHAYLEDEHLYPLVARIMGSPQATRTMSRDHVEVARLTRQLEWALQQSDTVSMRRLLYGLYHIVRLHFAKEEEIYLPLLERQADLEIHLPLAVASHAG
jgi:iron-sulfur cluster repair protein YtfE (RIC family)